MRLLLHSIDVQGFGSYVDHTVVEFDGRGPVAIVGPNGAGKSTIASKALAWCLYGKTAPERMGSSTGTMRGKSIMNPGAKEATVMVALRASSGDMTTITRVRRRTGSDDVSINSEAATQADIDAIIGVDYDVFVQQGSEAKCRSAGQLRVEGKDYVVQDGDIITVRFNV